MFTEILSYKIFNGTKSELLEYIKDKSKINIVSGNPEVLYNGLKNQALYKAFTGDNSIIIPDGVGTLLAAKITKKQVKEKIAGIEVMEEILKICEKENKGIYLLGAKEDTLNCCTDNIRLKYPKLSIVGSHNGFFDMNNCQHIIKEIQDKSPVALFVAMGSPRQDLFIINNMEKLPCMVYMGVGGSFDIFAGTIKRAPQVMINLRLEWLYRVVKEPIRIGRLLVIPKFLFKVLLKRKNNI